MDSRYGHLLNWIVLAGGIAGILYPAFIDERESLTQILISLFEPKPTLGFAMRWLSTFLLLGSAYILLTNYLYRNVPISVIWTKLDVYFVNPDGSEIRVDREQALRANQPGVTAYFMSSRPTSENGTIPEHKIKAKLYSGDIASGEELDLHGTESRGFEILYLFDKPLPYA
jgi:hypothetical protein